MGRMTYTPETKVLDAVNIEILAKAGLVVASAALVGADLVVFGGRGKLVRILCKPVRMQNEAVLMGSVTNICGRV
jgi:hypothetical protein